MTNSSPLAFSQVHQAPEPAGHGNQYGPYATKGFGNARDFLARIEHADYNPFRMAKLHSTLIQLESAQIEADLKAAAQDKNARRRERQTHTTEEIKEQQRKYHLARMAKRYADNPNIAPRVVMTPKEKKEHLKAREKAKYQRAKARKAAAQVAVYAYPQGPDGRLLKKKAGEVLVAESVSLQAKKSPVSAGLECRLEFIPWKVCRSCDYKQIPKVQ